MVQPIDAGLLSLIAGEVSGCNGVWIVELLFILSQTLEPPRDYRSCHVAANKHDRY